MQWSNASRRHRQHIAEAPATALGELAFRGIFTAFLEAIAKIVLLEDVV